LLLGSAVDARPNGGMLLGPVVAAMMPPGNPDTQKAASTNK